MGLSIFVRVGRGLFRGYQAFLKGACNTQSLGFKDQVLGGVLLFFVAILVFVIPFAYVYDTWENFSFGRLAPAEHFAKAKAACGDRIPCGDIQEAYRQIRAIPTSAPEYGEASAYLAEIRQQRDIAEANAEKMEQDRAQQSLIEARDKADRNFQGLTHDEYKCETSTTGDPIVSFDFGTTWWKDDGRCADILEKRAEEKQRQRDADAKVHSYWSTTLRVDTDMDSSWLPSEERTCQTVPDAKGQVAIVTCGSHSQTTHNIPVQFWGGVDRNTPSDWKSRREKDLLSDQFVCRAID